LYTPDGNISTKIDVYPENTAKDANSDVKVLDVSPFIENDKITLKITLRNGGTKEGTALIEALFGGNSVAENEVKVGAGEEKIVEMTITGIVPGELLLSVTTDNSTQLKINIPEKINQVENPIEVPAEPITQEQYNSAKGTSVSELFSFLERPENQVIVIAGAALIVFFAVVSVAAFAMKKIL
jgi:hypothetical protein